MLCSRDLIAGSYAPTNASNSTEQWPGLRAPASCRRRMRSGRPRISHSFRAAKCIAHQFHADRDAQFVENPKQVSAKPA